MGENSAAGETRWAMTVAYDGSALQGWQSQPSGQTVQDLLEAAFGKIVGKAVRVHGSGRTDAGVHADGQVFHVDLPGRLRLASDKWPLAMNTRLPKSIRILDARVADREFHARFSAKGKVYRYRFVNGPIQLPRDAGWVWHHPQPLALDLVEEALGMVAGTHDFAAFAARRGNEPDPLPEDYFVRTIHGVEMKRDSRGVELTFAGDGFLYKMVRLLVGGVVSVGRGRITQDEFRLLLEMPSGKMSPFCAPPEGLTLERVIY